MRKYKLNENFFEVIDSEEKAYFLGFLFADGYVNEKLNMIDLTIHQKDKEILEKFVKVLYTNDRPLKIIRNNYLRLVINSEKITTDLKKHGCFQKKTFKLQFPTTIENNLIKHFIRGYFDGDGCITVDNSNTLNFSIVGTISFLTVVKKILTENCRLNDIQFQNRYPNRNNNIRVLRYGGNIIINRIYHFLYDDATIFLLRKNKKFLDILNNKPYFCNIEYSRKTHQKYLEYNGKYYNKSELSEILKMEINQNPNTIRRKLQNGWTINDIINIPLNKPRPIKLKTVLMLDENKKIINRYESVEIAAIENNCVIGSIYQAIHKNKRLLKHYWMYE